MMSSPVAFGSNVPQCPTFLTRNCRRMASTTSCEVGPTGLSINKAPSKASNSCIEIQNQFAANGNIAVQSLRPCGQCGAGSTHLLHPVQGLFYRGDHPA